MTEFHLRKSRRVETGRQSERLTGNPILAFLLPQANAGRQHAQLAGSLFVQSNQRLSHGQQLVTFIYIAEIVGLQQPFTNHVVVLAAAAFRLFAFGPSHARLLLQRLLGLSLPIFAQHRHKQAFAHLLSLVVVITGNEAVNVQRLSKMRQTADGLAALGF